MYDEFDAHVVRITGWLYSPLLLYKFVARLVFESDLFGPFPPMVDPHS